MKRLIFTISAFFALAASGFAQTPTPTPVTATKTITITVKGADETAAGRKADAIAEDFVLAVMPGLDQPLQSNGGTCTENPMDIYLRENADAVSPLIPCAVKLTAQGKRRVASAKLDNVFQKLIRQIVQRAVKDRRAIEAAELARKAAVQAADEIEPD